MIDIDHFKKINDEYGHAVGDRCWPTSAACCARVRVIDLPSRYGGEELCIVLPNTPVEGACKLAETCGLKSKRCCTTPARASSR
jgi:diguanylate cyclase (GGDEF)-like protein